MKELRPCKVKDKSGLFHAWEQYSDVLPPSPMIGGHGGGVVAKVFALVEFEDGSVERCEPYAVKFTDRKVPDPEAPQDTLKEKPAQTYKESKTRCPFCVEETNKNATVYEDTTNKEYFVYCYDCQIETIETYTTKAAAVNAFNKGKTKNIKEVLENGTSEEV